MLETLQAVISIVLIDLTLAGDNALVIGLAARSLPPRQRRNAIILGGAAAVVLRVVAAGAVTLLLQLPYLQLVGALALIVIAYRLVRPAPGGTDGHGREVRAAVTLREAIVTILVADAVMSLDNVLGVGAAAHGNIPLLAFGLALSIPIVLFGAAFVARLTGRFPQTVWLGALALVWTAAAMFAHEPVLHGPVAAIPAFEPGVTVGLMVLLWLAVRRRTASAAA